LTDAQTHADAPEANPARGRAPRIEVKRAERRRRKAGTLNRMAQFKLDIFDDSQLDLKNYVYRWVSDLGSRLRQATKGDDYDFVECAEIPGFDVDVTDTENGDNRFRMLTDTDKNGRPVYDYLLRKPRDYFDADMDENVGFREDIMEQRVHQASNDGFNPETGLYEEVDPEEAEADALFYAGKQNTLGSASGRRTGPVTRKPPSR
jgi:hypothetical protein